MNLYDLLEELYYDKETLTTILIQLDSWLERLHNHGFCIYDFNPKKIILENGRLTFNSFRNVINDLGINENAKKINIFQDCKIGLMAYNKMPVDGNMNQEHFNFLQTNLEKFNQNGQIPDEIYEYYEEVFRRLNLTYMNDYLVKKQQEFSRSQNTNSLRKTKSTEIGKAFNPEREKMFTNEAAYVNILLLPTFITLVYLISLFIFTFILK